MIQTVNRNTTFIFKSSNHFLIDLVCFSSSSSFLILAVDKERKWGITATMWFGFGLHAADAVTVSGDATAEKTEEVLRQNPRLWKHKYV